MHERSYPFSRSYVREHRKRDVSPWSAAAVCGVTAAV
nr:MAG TPA: hypothetical protein [Caudoviricetes sp.]